MAITVPGHFIIRCQQRLGLDETSARKLFREIRQAILTKDESWCRFKGKCTGTMAGRCIYRFRVDDEEHFVAVEMTTITPITIMPPHAMVRTNEKGKWKRLTGNGIDQYMRAHRKKDGEEMSELFNVEAEQLVLGSIMLNNDILLRLTGLEAEHFFDPVHAHIFSLAKRMIEEGRLASFVTMKPLLADKLADYGGPAYLVRMAGIGSLTGAPDVARELRYLWARRDMRQALDAATARVEEEDGGIIDTAAELQHRIARNLDVSGLQPPSRSFRKSLTEAFRELGQAYSGEDAVGVSTGLEVLDEMIGSLRPGRLYILAGRPSMGKTAVALTIANRVADSGRPVIFASLEMLDTDLANRSLSQALRMGGVRLSYKDIERAQISEEQYRVLIEAAKKYEERPFHTITRENGELTRLTLACRAAAQSMKGCGLIVVDYIQLMEVAGARTTFDRVSAASKGLKRLSLELRAPVLALSQLNRQVEERDDRRPRMGDLRASGEIEEDADVVMLMHRPEYYLDRDGCPTDSKKNAEWHTDKITYRRKIEINVAKNRSGAIGPVWVNGELEFNHVEDVQPERQEALEL